MSNVNVTESAPIDPHANIGICRIPMQSAGNSKVPSGTMVYHLADVLEAAASVAEAPSEGGDMWALVEKDTWEILHVSGFGEGMGSVLEFAGFESLQAFNWATVFPDICEDLAVAVRDAETAYKWADSFPDHRNAVIGAITTAQFAYAWAAKFRTHKDRMRDLVMRDTGSDPVYAWRWAASWKEDQDLMKPLIVNTTLASDWNVMFPDNQIPEDQIPPLPARGSTPTLGEDLTCPAVDTDTEAKDLEG